LGPTRTLTATYTDNPIVPTPGRLSFRIGTSATCGTSVVQTGFSAANLATGNPGSWTPATLAPATYYWCAQAVDGAGNASAWSATRQLIVATFSLTVTAGPAALSFGTLVPSTANVLVTNLTVTTNTTRGYTLTATDNHASNAMTSGLYGIPDWTGTGVTPTLWPTTTHGFGGITVLSATGGRDSKWGAAASALPDDTDASNYAGLALSPAATLHTSVGPTAPTDMIALGVRIQPSVTTPAGNYSSIISISVLANP